MKRATMIGFDRRIRVEWLDAIAGKQAEGMKASELRQFGHAFLRDEYPADEARRKTLTVLLHLWVNVPEDVRELRDYAAGLLLSLPRPERIALHWGLALATYPFFRDAADAGGRLLFLQDNLSIAQLKRRLAERWGERAIVERATRHVARTWIDWGVVRVSEQRGTYIASRPFGIAGPIASWMVEALLVGAEAESQAVAQVRKAPQLFPFALKVSAHELRRAPRLVVHRQRVDEEVVMLRRLTSRTTVPTSDPGQIRLLCDDAGSRPAFAQSDRNLTTGCTPTLRRCPDSA